MEITNTTWSIGYVGAPCGTSHGTSSPAMTDAKGTGVSAVGGVAITLGTSPFRTWSPPV